MYGTFPRWKLTTSRFTPSKWLCFQQQLNYDCLKATPKAQSSCTAGMIPSMQSRHIREGLEAYPSTSQEWATTNARTYLHSLQSFDTIGDWHAQGGRWGRMFQGAPNMALFHMFHNSIWIWVCFITNLPKTPVSKFTVSGDNKTIKIDLKIFSFDDRGIFFDINAGIQGTPPRSRHHPNSWYLGIPMFSFPLANWKGRNSHPMEDINHWVVVSSIFYVHPYLGKWSDLTNIFSDGLKPPTRLSWNYQLSISLICNDFFWFDLICFKTFCSYQVVFGILESNWRWVVESMKRMNHESQSKSW